MAINMFISSEAKKFIQLMYMNRITTPRKFLNMNTIEFKNALKGFFVFFIISGAQNIVIKE